jgi:hypothetical protein
MEEHEIQKGDWVVCIDAHNAPKRLTYGKKYQALENNKRHGVTTILNDNEIESRWFSYRFQKVKSRVIDIEEMIEEDGKIG